MVKFLLTFPKEVKAPFFCKIIPVSRVPEDKAPIRYGPYYFNVVRPTMLLDVYDKRAYESDEAYETVTAELVCSKLSEEEISKVPKFLESKGFEGI